MKNKKAQIWEIGTFWTLSIKFISDTIRDRGNPLTNYQKLTEDRTMDTKRWEKLT